jgi:hypothetical protein
VKKIRSGINSLKPFNATGIPMICNKFFIVMFISMTSANIVYASSGLNEHASQVSFEKREDLFNQRQVVIEKVTARGFKVSPDDAQQFTIYSPEACAIDGALHMETRLIVSTPPFVQLAQPWSAYVDLTLTGSKKKFEPTSIRVWVNGEEVVNHKYIGLFEDIERSGPYDHPFVEVSHYRSKEVVLLLGKIISSKHASLQIFGKYGNANMEITDRDRGCIEKTLSAYEKLEPLVDPTLADEKSAPYWNH